MLNKTRYIIIILTIFFSFNAKAQLKIENVSVINSQGHVLISWDYTGTGNIEVTRDSLEINTLVSIAIVEPSVGTSKYTYIDTRANADLNPRSYKVALEDDQNVYSDIVSTFHVTSTYDSCVAEMYLTWDDVNSPPLVPNHWTPQNFTVHANMDGTEYPPYNVDGSLREYTVENVPENVDNTFYIETHWISSNTDQSSKSNPITIFTDMPETPDYINAVSASVDGNSTNLKFEIAPNSEIDSYNLLKSDVYDGSFSIIETINSTDFTISTVDVNSDPENTISYYKLASIDACDNIKTESDISNNILLQIEKNELINSLSWNYFKEHDFLSTSYEIYRKTDDEPAELIRSITNYNAFEDDISRLQGEKLSGEFCYYIRAIKENSPDNYSQSNTVCVYLKPQINIPEAFTPNDDGTNDIFNAVFTFLPTDYEMKIFNRWGNIIFRTTDPEEGWDGKQSNGASAPTGTYIYYIKIDVPGSDSFERRGNVTVLYP
jgi:gliding motility-associated-like protein